MERTTYGTSSGNSGDIVVMDNLSFKDCVKLQESLKRLTAYEDTGLMPEEIKELQKKKEIPHSLPAPFDPDSVECGSCGSDIDVCENEDYKYCPYCGQKL